MMAMFRSFVSASSQLRQQQQPNGGPGSLAAPAESIESQFSCPICLEVYHKPVSIASCAHTFCGECLQPCLQVTSPLCPLCRVPFDPKKVERSSSVEKQLASYKAPCRGCNKKSLAICANSTVKLKKEINVSKVIMGEMKVTIKMDDSLRIRVALVKMRSHIASCSKVQEQMANCPKFVPVVPTSQPIPRCVQCAQPCRGETPATRAPTFFSIFSTDTSSHMTRLLTTASMKRQRCKQLWHYH
ncbi:RING finger protein 166 isoform X3 [Astatotilapia calliptera]|uniref:RING finger protein 166 isoform X3 n=1 Tax=Astatotilapia calliptera TaxID=8154 RepID=UPI000E41DC3B|nr:RING finger protein 166 isoform X3 [Astatotilapia calliptera]